MGKLSRTKGKVFELAMVKRFRQVMPGETVKRGLQARGGQCDEVPDVDMPALWVECKHGVKPNPRAALEQATRDAEDTGKLPVAIIKDNRKQPFVVLDLEDFLHIVAEWWHHSLRGRIGCHVEKSESTASSPVGFIHAPTSPTPTDTTESTE